MWKSKTKSQVANTTNENLSSKEKKELRKQFKSMDKNGDGVISFDEYVASCKDKPGISSDEEDETHSRKRDKVKKVFKGTGKAILGMVTAAASAVTISNAFNG